MEIETGCLLASGKSGMPRGRRRPRGFGKTERDNTTVEPLTYHGYTRTVWEELLHCHSAAGMIDLTVGAGYAAEAALRLKVP